MGNENYILFAFAAARIFPLVAADDTQRKKNQQQLTVEEEEVRLRPLLSFVSRVV